MKKSTLIAIKFIVDNPNEEDYILSHFAQFMNCGYCDDNSIQLSREWKNSYAVVLAYLSKIK